MLWAEVSVHYAAKSATMASSNGNPAAVTRRRPSGVVSTRPWVLSSAICFCRQRRARERGEALEVDAFSEPQSHQQELVRRFDPAQRLVGDDAVAVRFDPHQPGLRALLGRGGVAAAVDVEAAMRAGADAGIFAVAPIDEVVPALGARPRVVGDLVGRQSGGGADLAASGRRARGRGRHRARRACRRRAARRTACPARW